MSRQPHGTSVGRRPASTRPFHDARNGDSHELSFSSCLTHFRSALYSKEIAQRDSDAPTPETPQMRYKWLPLIRAMAGKAHASHEL